MNVSAQRTVNLWGFLEDAARRFPAKPAVVCARGDSPYARLRDRAAAFAGGLYALGVRKGTRVAVLSENSIDWVESVFALMRLGAVCVPLNWRLTAAEIHAHTCHAGVAVLLFSRALADMVPWSADGLQHTVCIDGACSGTPLTGAGLREHGTGPAAAVSPQDPSCIIYTAGTTGSPRGVVLTHGIQTWNTLNYTAACGYGPGDVELAPTPLFHASTFGRLFTYVFNAATAILCPSFDPGECLDLVARYRVTAITQAPTMYGMLLAEQHVRPRETRSLRRLVTGAAPMSPQEKQQLQAAFPGAACYDIYGMTEAAPGISVLGPGEFLCRGESVGHPMLSVVAAVCDEQGCHLPPGREGEILCRGPNIMAGYYRDPEATAAALAGGWLHTGDVGTRDRQGFLTITGRKKEIIVSGGINIHPGEPEAVLKRHPAVADAAVFGSPDATWGEQVIAAVVLKPGHACTEAALRQHCRANLAAFKSPRTFVFLDELPRNAARKVLRHELARQYAGGALPVESLAKNHGFAYTRENRRPGRPTS